MGASQQMLSSYGTVVAGSYLYSDDMEYTSNANAAGAGWTNFGTPGWAYNTAPAPLQGSFSLNLPTAADYVSRTYTANPDLWAFFMFQVTSFGGLFEVFSIQNSSTTLCKLEITGAGALQLTAGTVVSSTGAAAFLPATLYYVWVHYTKGTGANSIAEVYLSTTTTKPSVTLAISNGDATLNGDTLFFYSGITSVHVIDKFRLSTTSIGSNPT